MSAYTYEIVYKPTAKHGNADGLSRLPCGFDPQFESGYALVDLVEYEVFGTLPVSADAVKDASRRDAVLSSVIGDICNGRKLNKNMDFKDDEVNAFCRRETELTVCDGQGRTGTFVLGWRYDSERARRAWPRLKWMAISKIIMGPWWRSPLSHPGQTAPGHIYA